MRIALCDDDQYQLNRLKTLIKDYINEKNYSCTFYLFSSGETLLSDFHKGSYDIIFLDVYLQGIDGMETARQIRSIDENVFLVFATSSMYHAIESYHVSALYYLLKPIKEDNLRMALSRCETYMNHELQTITVTSKKQEHVIIKREILYAEIYDKLCKIHLDNGEIISTYITLDHLMEELGGLPFIRCHQSYIINYQSVNCIKDGKYFKIKTEELIPIPRNRKKELINSYNQYLINSIRNI
ncbi:two-component response regulator [Lachnospiraceae bacterium KM106-2]|nr:two-component response regulator [Lachnospiraceae bacterium KM106-2]